MTMLADFIMLGHENVGSFALGASKVDLFVAAVESWVRTIAEVFNNHAIPRLMTLNGFDLSRLPRLTYGQVSAIDLVELGTYLANLASADLITPDNTLEEHLRELAGLPAFHADPDGETDNVRYGYSVTNPSSPDPSMGGNAPDAGAAEQPVEPASDGSENTDGGSEGADGGMQEDAEGTN
jgi:hypothetical protein